LPARSSSSGVEAIPALPGVLPEVLPEAPPAEAFPAYPASWYLFGESRELDRGPVSRQILGRRLVAFRSESGRAAVIDGRCAHLGADLGCGTVVGETLRCPFHHWRYGVDGVCVAVPNQAEVPAFARLRSYPVEERHGYLFFFNGREPLFPLPFVLGEDPRDFVAGRTFQYVADCTWYMNSAHAFDRQHFAAVHDRELLAPPVVDCPAPYARRNSYPARVVGHTVFDRLLRVGAGRTVEITLTIWGGTFAVVTSRFPRVESGFLMVMQPREDGQTLCQGIVLARRGAPLRRPLAAAELWVRRLFTHGYLREEARLLRSTRYSPGSLGENDRDMIDFFRWVASLPQAPPVRKPSAEREDDHEEGTRAPAAVAAVHARGGAGRVGAGAIAGDG
jgi:nitrite reductase/ring-hydroxylating ferredoxin subunit